MNFQKRMILWFKDLFMIGHQEFNHEQRFVLNTAIVIGVFSGISTFNNNSLGFGIALVLVPALSVIVYAGIFYIGRYLKKFLLAKQIITIYSILFLNFMWVYNFGSKGPVVFAYVVFFSFLTFIWDTKPLLIITLVVLLNILLMFYLDYNFPDLIPDYPSMEVRHFDYYVGVLFFLVFVFVVSYSAKLNYKKEYENAKRSDQLKSAFLANMSHEIRTPLNSIVGFSELLCDDNLTIEKKERFVKIIQDNNQSLLRLIEDILDISRIESNQLRIEKQAFSLNELMLSIDTTYQKLIKNKGLQGIELVLGIQQDSKISMYSDVSRIHQIIINLLDNALKFTEEGSIKFGYFEKGQMIEFYVSDTGIGIGKEHFDKLFDRFYKIENKKGKLYKGTGIGLSLCKDLVTILGGTIDVQSEIGKGTIFTFTLPKTL